MKFIQKLYNQKKKDIIVFDKQIGNGSYGKVYLSIEKQTKKPYAIKIQQKNYSYINPKYKIR